MDEAVSYPQLMQAISSAGLAQSIVCLHSSLKSFGHLQGGADTLLRAFVDSGCTLLVPTFTDDQVSPPAGREILQNAWRAPDVESNKAYDPKGNLLVPEMGAIPACLLATSGRVRGLHPLDSFAALGPLAGELIATQTLLDVYGPYKEACARPPAFLLLVGVDLTKATPIHLAEEKAGRRLFRRWAYSVDSPSVQEVAIGSCSEGFNRFAPTVRSIERRTRVGKSDWRWYPLAAFVETVSAAIRENPQITHCDNANCERCNDGVKGGPLL